MNYIKDPRQSDNWAKYLEFLGWSHKRTRSGVLISYRKMPIGALVKIQRPQPLGKSDLEEIEEVCREIKAFFIKIEPNIGQDEDVLDKLGYEKSRFPLVPTKTMIVDLKKSEEDLWKALSRSGKYSTNRARREEAKVEFYKNPPEEKLEIYHDIHVYTGREKKFYTQPYKELLKKVELWGDESYLALVYNKDGTLAGGKFYLCEEKNVLYHLGATSREGRKTKAGYLMTWESILYFKNLGYEILDLEGLTDDRFPEFTKKWGGFANFKDRFGGEVVVFPHPRVKYLNAFFRFLAKYTPLAF